MWRLTVALSLHDLRWRYHKTRLRPLWLIIKPLISVGIFTAVFSKIASLPSEEVPYPIFTLTALVFWMFFSSSITASCYSLTSQRHLITRIRFQRITIPISTILSNFYDFIVYFLMLVVILYIYQFHIGVNVVYIVPVFTAQLLLTLGVCFILSVAGIYFPETKGALPILIQAWMLASPVAYSLHTIHKHWGGFYLLNPMAGIIDSYRQILLHNQPPDWHSLTVSWFLSASIFLLGLLIFKSSERYLADII